MYNVKCILFTETTIYMTSLSFTKSNLLTSCCYFISALNLQTNDFIRYKVRKRDVTQVNNKSHKLSFREKGSI